MRREDDPGASGALDQQCPVVPLVNSVPRCRWSTVSARGASSGLDQPALALTVAISSWLGLSGPPVPAPRRDRWPGDPRNKSGEGHDVERGMPSVNVYDGWYYSPGPTRVSTTPRCLPTSARALPQHHSLRSLRQTLRTLRYKAEVPQAAAVPRRDCQGNERVTRPPPSCRHPHCGDNTGIV